MSKKIVPAFLMLAMAILAVQCTTGTGQSLEVDWYYTIPDGYQGFLVIRYECAGGKPLVIQDGKIYLEFDDDGTACINDTFRPNHGQVFAQHRNGQPIRVVGSPWNENGYALYTAGVRGIERYGVDYGTFVTLWVGDMEYLAANYLKGLDQFLEDRFGIPTVD